MTLNRWKVLACTLTVGVGGLAVFATPPASNKTDASKEPAPLPELTVKPTSPANGTDTPPPVKPAKTEEFNLVVPDPVVAPASPTKTEEPAKNPDTEPVFEPVTRSAPMLLPAGGTNVKDGPKPEEPKKPEADKVPSVIVLPPVAPEVKDAPSPVRPMPDVPKVEGSKPPMLDLVPPPVGPMKGEPPAVAPPSKPEQTLPIAPPALKDGPMVVPAISPDADSVKLPLTPPAATKSGSSAPPARLKMLLRMGDGQPRFEIRNSTTTELLLKVYGEKVEMQAPPDAKSTLAGVTAMGRVRFTAPGVEGTCDHLSILSGTGEVLLKGNIHMKTKHGKAWSEMTAEKMVYQIGTAGLSGSGARTAVTPASYIPD